MGFQPVNKLVLSDDVRARILLVCTFDSDNGRNTDEVGQIKTNDVCYRHLDVRRLCTLTDKDVLKQTRMYLNRQGCTLTDKDVLKQTRMCLTDKDVLKQTRMCFNRQRCALTDKDVLKQTRMYLNRQRCALTDKDVRLRS